MAVGQAAEHLCLSRRTAERRLAAARKALSAATTTEAVIRAHQLTGSTGRAAARPRLV